MCSALCLVLVVCGSNNERQRWSIDFDGPKALWTTPIASLNTSLDTEALSELLLAVYAVDGSGELKSNKRGGGWHSSELLVPGGVISAALAGIPHRRRLLRELRRAAELIISGSNALLGPRQDAFLQNMWFLANSDHNFNVYHTHPNAVLSGVLHLSSGASAKAAAPTVFGDPRPSVACRNSSRRTMLRFQCDWCEKSRLCPYDASAPSTIDHLGDTGSDVLTGFSPGRLLLWPSWLPHEVPRKRWDGAGTPAHPSVRRMALSFNLWSDAPPNRPVSLPAGAVAIQRDRTSAFFTELDGLGVHHQPAPTTVQWAVQRRWPTLAEEFTARPASFEGSSSGLAAALARAFEEERPGAVVLPNASVTVTTLVVAPGPLAFPGSRLPGRPVLAGLLVLRRNTGGKWDHCVKVTVPDPRLSALVDAPVAGAGLELKWLGAPSEGLVLPAWIMPSAAISVLPRCNDVTLAFFGVESVAGTVPTEQRTSCTREQD